MWLRQGLLRDGALHRRLLRERFVIELHGRGLCLYDWHLQPLRLRAAMLLHLPRPGWRGRRLPVRVLSGSSLWHVRSVVAACGEASETARDQFGEAAAPLLLHGARDRQSERPEPAVVPPQRVLLPGAAARAAPARTGAVTLSRSDDQFLRSLSRGR